MTRALQTTLCLLILAAVVASCSGDNRLNVDVSGVAVEVKLERADRLWDGISPVRFRESHPRYLREYNSVYTHYIEDVMKLGSINDSNLYTAIREFVKHPDMEQVFIETEAVYPENSNLENELETAWKHYVHYFPSRVVPYQFACVCGFNNPYIVADSGIGLCLEMFLGADCRFYDYLYTPRYLRQRLTPRHLVPWMMKGWLETEFAMDAVSPSLLEEIVHAGKIFYCLDAVFPTLEDSLKAGYTAAQMQWAHDHERLVWAHFVDNNLLFEADKHTVSKFTADGPFTVDLAKESPSRMGHFVGWQMVRSYMARQETIDLEKLMATPAREILDKSKYKP